MVENMQEKRSLFLHQIDSIRKKMVLSTPELRWAPLPPTIHAPSPPSSPSLSHSNQPRTPPPRTPPSLHHSSSLSNPSLPQTPHSPSSRTSHHSRPQSPISLDHPSSLNSPNLRRMSPSPLLYAGMRDIYILNKNYILNIGCRESIC